VEPTGFGLQDPEFTQYKISPYSLMRLHSSAGEPVFFDRNGQWYSNITMGPRDFLLVPYTLEVNYSSASKLLGINNMYGFQLTLTPIVTVSIDETQLANSLRLDVDASGVGFPLSQAEISYCFLKVLPSGPSYEMSTGTVTADATGSASIEIDYVMAGDAYAFIAYVNRGGLVGMGYTQRTSGVNYVVPFVDSFEEGRVLIAHSFDVDKTTDPNSAVFYNATFVLMTEDFTLREMPLMFKKQHIVYGSGSQHSYDNVTIPTFNPGILVIPYQSNNAIGVVLMPWGISSLAFPVTFGGDPAKQEWVATDMRQVTVGGMAYQAKIALWSLEGYQVVG
jgi:hypothetical protein